MINLKQIFEVLKSEDNDTVEFILEEVQNFISYEPDVFSNKNIYIELLKEDGELYFELSFRKKISTTLKKLKVFKFKYLKNKQAVDNIYYEDGKEEEDRDIFIDNVSDVLIDFTRILYRGANKYLKKTV